MSKVTSKLQVTIPRRIADEYGIAPGDEIEFIAAGASIRVVKSDHQKEATTAERLVQFDRATARQKTRQRSAPRSAESGSRGWTREGLYDRGRTR